MRLMFCGDVFSDRIFELQMDAELRECFLSCEYSCFNLEGPINHSSPRKAGKRGPYLLNDGLVIKMLKSSGFNMVSLANNHIMDYGSKGLENTIISINKEGMQFVGAGMNGVEAYKYLSLNGDVSVGVISVAEKQFGASEDDSPGFAWMCKKDVYEQIKEARRTCDAVIVLCHCGAECVNVPLPEVREIYRQFIDFGADIVIGNHAHVIQGCEEYKKKKIYYCLGNLIWVDSNGADDCRSLGIIVDVQGRDLIISDELEMRFGDGYLSICHDKEDFLQANQAIDDEEIYLDVINRFCLKYYEENLKYYYGLIIGFDLYHRDRQIAFLDHRRADDPIKWDNLFVYHNAVVESNRWIAERAVKLIESL